MATLILEHSPDAGAGRLGTTLRDRGHRLDIRRLDRGDPVPADLDDVDAIVTCGGPQSPVDESPAWMAPELELLAMAHAAALPVLGICLGNQFLVRALGGAVEPLEGEPACGWGEVTLTPVGREDPLFAGIAWKSRQLHWNGYHATQLPDDARVLATSDRTPVEAWALGLRTYGVQYHPEALRESIAKWADDDPEWLAKSGTTRAELDTATAKHYETFARLGDRFAAAVALVLMPVDRRYAGIARDLHH